MEVGKTYCTRCGREVKGFTCQICDPTIPVKQLTIEEAEKQFIDYMLGSTNNDYNNYSDNKKFYLHAGYMQSLKVNGILIDEV